MGSAIQGTNLREQDINVLTLYRGAKIIPNPRADRILEPNDKLLCFGKMNSMRDMVPAKPRRRRNPKITELPPNLAEATKPEDLGD